MTASTLSRRPSLPRRPQRRSALGGTLIGVFIGIVVGLGLAATVAYWLMKNNPALPMPSLSRNATENAKDAPSKLAKADADKPRFDFYKILPGGDEPKAQPERRPGDRTVVDQAKDRSADKSAPRPPAAVADAGVAKGEKTAPADTKTTKAAESKPADAKAGDAKAADRFWLQAGSFSTPPDAENLRARLALAGWEATVQEGSLPDKSIRYRVRLGPYDNSDELGRMKSELAKRGFDAAVIRN
jgi:cell division protein FtsN